jgi:rRNA-processing protein FCF1
MAADWSRNITVILDANALLMPFQFNINLDSELTRLLGSYKVIIPTSVIDELNRLASSGEPPAWIKPALSLAQKYEKEPVSGLGDEAIFTLACKYKAIVVTNDRILRSRLRSNGLKTISLRGRTHLVID